MKKSFEKIGTFLKKDGIAVFIIGDSIINGIRINGDKIIIDLANQVGMKFIDKIDYSQDLSSKMFNSAFRQKGKMEHIILFKR
jgi:hypothetical protein